MKDKREAQNAVIKMKKYLLDVSVLELDKGIDTDSPYSKVYWLYQDIVNFMDQHNQHQTESWIDQAKWIVEHPLIGMGYDTLRYRHKLEMAVIQMGHGLGVNWSKKKFINMSKSYLLGREELGFIIAALEYYIEDWEYENPYEEQIPTEHDRDLSTIKELIADLKSEYENY